MTDGINLHSESCSDTLCAGGTGGVRWGWSEQGGGQSNNSLEDSELWTKVTGNILSSPSRTPTFNLLFQNLTTSQHQHSYCPGPSCHHLTWVTVLAFSLEISQLTHCPFRHSSRKDPVKMWVRRSAPYPPMAPASFRGIRTIWSLIASLISSIARSTPAQLEHT